MPGKIKSVAWKVTERCNSRCKTCNHWQHPNLPDSDTDEAINLINQLLNYGIKAFRLTGGEPLLRDDLPLLVKKIYAGGGTANLNTNLIDITNLPERLNALFVPFDGFYDVYENIRGVDKCDQVLQNLEKVKDKYKIVLSMILTDGNIDEITWIIKLCKKIGAKLAFNLVDSAPYFFQEDYNLVAVENWYDIVDILLTHYDPVFLASREKIKSIPKFYESKPACRIPLYNIKIDGIGRIYPGCWCVDPIGWIRTRSSLREILDSDHYKRIVQQLVDGNCPNCTCGWMQRC